MHSVSVAGVVVDRDSRVLLICRRDTAEWQIPGGVLDRGEGFVSLFNDVYGDGDWSVLPSSA